MVPSSAPRVPSERPRGLLRRHSWRILGRLGAFCGGSEPSTNASRRPSGGLVGISFAVEGASEL
eukprot:8922916-Pyramimonas_sp.AAC.1